MQAGKEASGEGVYMLCLNLPTSASRTPNDVRIISLTPPGVKSDTVLRAIVSDVVKGMKEGFLDFDADGNKRRIFLDLVGFVGDTPALNASLDVMGHTSSVCCHLCRFVRQSATIIGSRYTGKAPDGYLTSSRRGAYQEQSIRDCTPGPETCRLLGLKYQTGSPGTVLHYIRSQLHSTKGCIPKTVEGQPVVPGTIDPYKACIIAPDHLLTGHARDCINIALQYLPRRASREQCEKYMLESLDTCKLPTQRRIVNHEKKKLYSMTMTELYALSLVAWYAFVKVRDILPREGNCPVAIRKLDQAIDLVQSAGKLIARFWFKPNIEHDSTLDVALFEEDGGNKYFLRMRTVVNQHIALVEGICTMPDCDALNISNSTYSRVRRAELTRERQLCDLARRTVDKPNVHRLRELVYETLPMFGHVSIFGELPLEKTHQQLKRAIKMSNQKSSHIQAMDSAIFRDWQGRLSMAAPLAAQSHGRYVLACYRLLCGREKVFTNDGILLKVQKELVLECLGGCILKELSRQGQLVLSRRLLSHPKSETWTLKNGIAVVNPMHSTQPNFAEIQDESRDESLTLVLRIFRERLHYCTLQRSRSATRCLGSGIPEMVISSGDIVEILTIETSDLASHYPFVLQSNIVKNTSRVHCPSLWLTEEFFCITDASNAATVIAVLRPCVLADCDSPFQEKAYTVVQDMNLTIAEMDVSIHRVPIVQKNANSFIPLTRKGGYPPKQG